MSPRLIALDVSLVHTGLTNIDGYAFSSKGGKGDARLRRLYNDVHRIALDADLAIMEDLPKNAMGAGLTGQAVGVARMALSDRGVPAVKVVASTLKLYATGSGRADKAAMIHAANTLKAGEGLTWPRIEDDNEADAFCLWQLGRAWLRGDARARAANVNTWSEWDLKLKELVWQG